MGHLLFQITTTTAARATWTWVPWAAGGAAVFCLFIAAIFERLVARRTPGDERMVELSSRIRSGVFSYIKREYVYVAAVAAAMIVLVAVALRNQDGPMIALCYVLGVLFALLAGMVGLHVATRANSRTAQAAKGSLRSALNVAFRSGAVMGLAVAGLALLGLAICYLVFESLLGFWNSQNIILGFVLGSSTVALFACVGGGIFTKAADVGADTAGKLEGCSNEDDPRNAALIADDIGDNVGGVAGVGADLFESYVAATAAPIVIAAMGGVFRAVGADGMVLPLAIAGAGAVCSAIGVWLVHLFSAPGFDYWFRRMEQRAQHAVSCAVYVTAVLATAASMLLVRFVLGAKHAGLIWAPLLGIAAGVVIALSTEYFTSGSFNPVKNLAASAEAGPAMVSIRGLALGMGSTLIPVAAIAIATGVAYFIGNRAIAGGGGPYAIGLAALGMLTVTGVVVAANAFGPVADNADGIARMADLEEEALDVTENLDNAGKAARAVARGFAAGSAALVMLSLLAAYALAANMSGLDLVGNWRFLVGILIGAVVPFVFAAIIIGAVGRAAGEVIEEVRSQFRGMVEASEGEEAAKPDYGKCTGVASRSALYEMLPPASIAVVAPLLVGAFLGKQSLAGFLLGALATGFLLAIVMTNTGSAWDSARKLIERGLHGGVGADAHDAALVANALGDPLKDAAGPAMNILIKLMAIISLVFVPLFLK